MNNTMIEIGIIIGILLITSIILTIDNFKLREQIDKSALHTKHLDEKLMKQKEYIKLLEILVK